MAQTGSLRITIKQICKNNMIVSVHCCLTDYLSSKFVASQRRGNCKIQGLRGKPNKIPATGILHRTVYDVESILSQNQMAFCKDLLSRVTYLP